MLRCSLQTVRLQRPNLALMVSVSSEVLFRVTASSVRSSVEVNPRKWLVGAHIFLLGSLFFTLLMPMSTSAPCRLTRKAHCKLLAPASTSCPGTITAVCTGQQVEISKADGSERQEGNANDIANNNGVGNSGTGNGFGSTGSNNGNNKGADGGSGLGVSTNGVSGTSSSGTAPNSGAAGTTLGTAGEGGTAGNAGTSTTGTGNNICTGASGTSGAPGSSRFRQLQLSLSGYWKQQWQRKRQ